MQHKLADIATKNTANNALMTSMTERVGELGSLQTEFQNINKRIEALEEDCVDYVAPTTGDEN